MSLRFVIIIQWEETLLNIWILWKFRREGVSDELNVVILWPVEFGNIYIVLKYESKDELEILTPSAWENEYTLKLRKKERKKTVTLNK